MTRAEYIRRKRKAAHIEKIAFVTAFSILLATVSLLVTITVTTAHDYIELKQDQKLYSLAEDLTAQGYTWDISRINFIDDEDYRSWKWNNCFTPTHTYDDYISYSDTDGLITDDMQVDYVRGFLHAVEAKNPDILDRIFEDGWTIQVITGSEMHSLNRTDKNLRTLGLTVHSDKVIYINGWCGNCVIHEIGHVLCSEYGFKDVLADAGYTKWDSKGLDHVYTHLGDYSPYGYVDFEEHICDLWNEYFCFPKEFMFQDPALYSVFDSYVNNF